jgi:hypothetical protein
MLSCGGLGWEHDMPDSDFVVQSSDHQTQLVIEVKKKVPASSEWAVRMRRNLYAHGLVPPAKFFLLALPERFYLWKNADAADSGPPHYEVDAEEVLKPYAHRLHTPLPQLSRISFELLVQSWLEDLINGKLDGGALDRSHRWLRESGLYDAIKNGFIQVPQKSA